MEKLELSLKSFSFDLGRKEAAPAENPMYEGFVKLESRNYSGPTSIRYWM